MANRLQRQGTLRIGLRLTDEDLAAQQASLCAGNGSVLGR